MNFKVFLLIFDISFLRSISVNFKVFFVNFQYIDIYVKISIDISSIRHIYP